MRILIVEDESLAVSRLQILLKDLINEYEIVGIAKSIEEAVKLINENEIDLGFFDIQIEDGISLTIFESTEVAFPVIFTTAYNDYAIRAFKYNSIDYLLKPISDEELQNALTKFENIWNKHDEPISTSIIDEMKQLLAGNFKERFSVRIGNKIEILKTDEVSFFYSYNKGTFAKTSNNRDMLLDSALELIYPLLNPKQFFKISRKHIVNINYIKDIYAYSNSRLKVNIANSGKEELIVSREKVKSFKDWLENN